MIFALTLWSVCLNTRRLFLIVISTPSAVASTVEWEDEEATMEEVVVAGVGMLTKAEIAMEIGGTILEVEIVADLLGDGPGEIKLYRMI